MQSPVTRRLLAVACLSVTACIAVGDGGVVVVTSDSGRTWRPARSRSSQELDGIACPTGGHCIVIGYLGGVLQTKDGGRTWVSSPSLDATLTGIGCHASLCAVVSLRTDLNTPAKVYFSDDAGSSWVGQLISNRRNFFGIDCVSESTCTAVGDQGVVDITRDGGMTWSETNLPELGSLHAVDCVGSALCLVGGDFGSVYRRTGTASVEVAPGEGPGASRQVVESIACPSALRCWAVGDQGTISASTDGGSTWRQQHTSVASGYGRVLLVGDSVAQSFGSELPALATSYGLYVADEGILGCGIAQGEPVRAGGVVYGDVATPCDGQPGVVQWPQYWQQFVTQFDPQVAVLLAGYWEVTDRYFQGSWSSIDDPAFRTYLAGQLEEAVTTLSARGATVVLLTSPYFDTGDFPESDPARVDLYNSLVRSVAANHPGIVTVIDLNAFVDPGGRFTSTVGGTDVRSPDGEHFTNAGSALVARWLLPQLAALVKP